ncbi:GntR family transcriptional regulator [Rhodobacteraceae bacterium M385]|nr:GntR family transcriptional regulator [Rhodobacteraceae bacterium M385]
MSKSNLSSLVPPPSQTATERAFKVIYDAVISLKLPPGTKITENDVAKQLDMSRQPVRDAFFRLSKLGFLSIRPQTATLVTPISEQAVLDAVLVRTALEVECLRLAMERLTAADLARLNANLDDQKEALDHPDPAVFHALDEAFHETLCEIAGHAHVWKLIQEQKAHMDRIRFLTLSQERRQQVLDEHRGFVAAIESGDAAEATAHLRAHLASIRTILGDIRARYPDYFETSK